MNPITIAAITEQQTQAVFRSLSDPTRRSILLNLSRVDKNKFEMKDTVLKNSIFINAEPEAIWPFLVEREKLAEWFHPADEDLVVDKDYSLLDSESLALLYCPGLQFDQRLNARRKTPRVENPVI